MTRATQLQQEHDFRAFRLSDGWHQYLPHGAIALDDYKRWHVCTPDGRRWAFVESEVLDHGDGTISSTPRGDQSLNGWTLERNQWRRV